MSQGDPINGCSPRDRDLATTLLVLVALREAHPRPLSTYELGLAIMDDHSPPRPLSVLVKTLSKDKYIERAALIGKRAGCWSITDLGLKSLARRPQEAQRAADWIKRHPNYTDAERSVMESLMHNGPQPAARLATSCSMLHSPIRTALKRLLLRGIVRQMDPPSTEYDLTTYGHRVATSLSAHG